MNTQTLAIKEYQRILIKHLEHIDPILADGLLLCLPTTYIAKNHITIDLKVASGLREYIEDNKITAENLITNLTNAPEKVDIIIK